MDRHPEVERWLVAASGWPDPHASAHAVVAADVGLLASRLAERLRSRRSEIDFNWNEAWTAASLTAWDIVDEVLGDAGSAENAVAEGAAVRAVSAAVPSDAIIAVGNGLPVRSLDWYLPAVTGSWQVWCQRGASGIDGLIAGAAGASLAAGRPVVAVLGDVAFAHDASSLAVAKDVQHPLVLVVLDNRGGRLFELLPEAKGLPRKDFERLWLTPPSVDPTAVARAYGVPAVSASTAAETTRAVAEATGRPGATVVRVAVDPSSHARDLAEIRRRLAARWNT
jgi:2-succinyl-5-enolpyruvyl-6-hydroxy-3-cyclohexene-1-carboxylate synthase